eukprot:12178022-Alexandrium_andersonii.AAC.1
MPSEPKGRVKHAPPPASDAARQGARPTNAPSHWCQSSTRQTVRQTQPAAARRARGPQAFSERAAAWATDSAVATGQRGAPWTP